ncbi:MAG: quinone-dependent dihydroorotate dehydrogenase [Betaproteobacteria bacterium]|nr:quinone-dependent dihydroorotate dehydrogenase [Betaproteobacteria bacterium]
MLYTLLRPALFRLDGETAHDIGLRALDRAKRLGLLRRPEPFAGRTVECMGITFPNPVGLAAGLDKNARHVDALASFGFGFIEVGTVTPRPQPGNPRPRLFRLAASRAIINRMGFNNDGLDTFLANVSRTRYRGVLGINIGKNFDTPIDRADEDYVIGLRATYPHAHYVTVNISSPNTKNLRALQEADALDRLLGRLGSERAALAARHGRHVPLALKIAPDLDPDQLEAIADAVQRHHVDGLIATNTTLARDGVAGQPHADEQGGLSGAPLFERSTGVVRALSRLLDGRVPIIAAGGIMCADDAKRKLDAGATLVQVYSGLVYRGPGLVREIVAATL